MTKENITFKQSKYNINVEEEEYHKSVGYKQSWLILKFSGKDFNIKIMNSLRRIATNNIPIYAFPPELINIDTNTTVAFNNDYMKLRLSLLPVMGIDPDIYFLNDKYWYKVNYADTKREKHEEEKLVEFYVNQHNNSSNIVSITTNDISMYIDGEQFNPYNSDSPHLLIKLRPGDRFKCYMKAVLGIGEKHVMWASARNAFYDEISDGVFKFTIEGINQFHEYDTMIRSCKYLIKKLTDLKLDLEHKIALKEILPEKIIHLRLEKEDFTLGEILNYEFQDHNDIIASGNSKPDHLVKAILIKVTGKGNTPIYAMLECITILIEKTSHIGYIISNLQKKKSK